MENQENPTRPTRSWLRPGRVILGLVGVLAIMAGVAWATGMAPTPFGHGFCKAGMARDFVEFRLHRALTQVNATETQEEKIMAIINTQFVKHQEMAKVHEEMHEKFVAAMTGDTVDRAAIETLRVEALGRIDQCSKDLAKSVAEAAEVLTPAQRKQLAELCHKNCQ